MYDLSCCTKFLLVFIYFFNLAYLVVVQLVYVEPFNRASDKSKAQGGPDSKKDLIIHRDGNSQNIATDFHFS